MAIAFKSYTAARAHLKVLLDAAAAGLPASVRRDSDRFAVADVDRYLALLRLAIIDRAEVVSEAGGWSVFIPNLPVAAEGSTFDEAIDEMAGALREYADDWEQRLRFAPNHADKWALVQLIALSDDQELRDWLVGAGK